MHRYWKISVFQTFITRELDVPCSLRFTGNDEVKCKKLENLQLTQSSLAETGVEYPDPYALHDTSVAGTTSQQVTTTVMVKKASRHISNDYRKTGGEL